MRVTAFNVVLPLLRRTNVYLASPGAETEVGSTALSNVSPGVLVTPSVTSAFTAAMATCPGFVGSTGFCSV